MTEYEIISLYFVFPLEKKETQFKENFSYVSMRIELGPINNLKSNTKQTLPDK